MQNKYIKIISSSILLATLTFFLPSCGKGKINYDPTNFLPNGHGQPGDEDYRPYQIVRDPITITIFAPHGAGNPEYKTLKMFRYLTYLTNIDFEFITPDEDQYNTRRASVWESGDKPDLFLFNNDVDGQVQFVEEGYQGYYPLNDDNLTDSYGFKVGNLIDNYMPNYKALLENNFNIDREQEDGVEIATLSDGFMYSCLSVNDVVRDSTFKMFINEVWIENCYKKSESNCYKYNIKSASDIQTIEQFKLVMEDFKNLDANNNKNNNDEVPISGMGLDYLRDYILEAYGYVDHTIEIEDDESAFTFVPTTDAFREYLKTMNQFWKDGILDHSIFEYSDYTAIGKKGSEGKLGCFVAAAPYLVTKENNKDEYNKRSSGAYYMMDEEYTTLMPLTSFMNDTKKQQSFGRMVADGACICADSPYSREIARLLDIMYSELGQQLIAFGVENEDWHWEDEETKTYWIKDVPSDWTDSEESYRATLTPNVTTGCALYWSNDFIAKTKDTVTERLNAQCAGYEQYFKVPVPEKYKFTAAEYVKLGKCFGNFSTSFKLQESTYIKGSSGADPNSDTSWANFVYIMNNSCKSGNTHAITIYNDMLNRYKQKEGK